MECNAGGGNKKEHISKFRKKWTFKRSKYNTCYFIRILIIIPGAEKGIQGGGGQREHLYRNSERNGHLNFRMEHMFFLSGS